MASTLHVLDDDDVAALVLLAGVQCPSYDTYVRLVAPHVVRCDADADADADDDGDPLRQFVMRGEVDANSDAWSWLADVATPILTSTLESSGAYDGRLKSLLDMCRRLPRPFVRVLLRCLELATRDCFFVTPTPADPSWSAFMSAAVHAVRQQLHTPSALFSAADDVAVNRSACPALLSLELHFQLDTRVSRLPLARLLCALVDQLLDRGDAMRIVAAATCERTAGAAADTVVRSVLAATRTSDSAAARHHVSWMLSTALPVCVRRSYVLQDGDGNGSAAAAETFVGVPDVLRPVVDVLLELVDNFACATIAFQCGQTSPRFADGHRGTCVMALCDAASAWRRDIGACLGYWTGSATAAALLKRRVEQDVASALASGEPLDSRLATRIKFSVSSTHDDDDDNDDGDNDVADDVEEEEEENAHRRDNESNVALAKPATPKIATVHASIAFVAAAQRHLTELPLLPLDDAAVDAAADDLELPCGLLFDARLTTQYAAETAHLALHASTVQPVMLRALVDLLFCDGRSHAQATALQQRWCTELQAVRHDENAARRDARCVAYWIAVVPWVVRIVWRWCFRLDDAERARCVRQLRRRCPFLWLQFVVPFSEWTRAMLAHERGRTILDWAQPCNGAAARAVWARHALWTAAEAATHAETCLADTWVDAEYVAMAVAAAAAAAATNTSEHHVPVAHSVERVEAAAGHVVLRRCLAATVPATRRDRKSRVERRRGEEEHSHRLSYRDCALLAATVRSDDEVLDAAFATVVTRPATLTAVVRRRVQRALRSAGRLVD